MHLVAALKNYTAKPLLPPPPPPSIAPSVVIGQGIIRALTWLSE